MPPSDRAWHVNLVGVADYAGGADAWSDASGTVQVRRAHAVTAQPAGTRSQGSDYTARHLSVLEGLEAVRKRPGMYIGSTDSRGLMHCLWEIIDNAVDEALAGHCDRVEVLLRADGAAEIRDNGRGIPIDRHSRSGLSGVEVVFTKLHAGGKFGGGSYAATGGLHGVGASVVNALSARLDVEVDRDGRTHAMSFRRGEPGTFSGDGPDAGFEPFTDHSELRVIGKTAKRASGTRVKFWADPQIFLDEAEYAWDELLSRARQTSYLIPGLELVIRDERGEAAVEEKFRHDGGISEFVEYLSPGAPVTDVLRLTGQDTFRETVPVLDEDGQLISKDTERTCEVDIALRWDGGYDTVSRSFVNVIATPKGGTHVTGFEQGLVKALREQVKANARRLKAGNDKIEKDDVLEGLTSVVTVRLDEPQFEGQTKEVLGTSAVRTIVAGVVEREMKAFLTSTKRATKPQASAVLEKVVSAAKARVAARLHKETVRRKNALETSTMPTKLVDCRSTSLDRSELFIVEGDSALGTGRSARDAEYQALLPIRGKILNVQKASVGDMLKNAECASIIQVVGAGSGRTFDIEQARYGKVILMVDADVDGAHIRTLLITLFFRYMRPFVEAGRLFAAVPPLHRIELINPKKGQEKYIYTYTDAELHRVTLDLQRKGVRWKEPPQRYKGLGEMDPDQLAETTMDPRHRRLRRITATDAEAAERMFELLMGNDVAPRKEFIIAGAAELDRDRIDA
ncbi:type IIA DNA topoisomerase subunit B [Actinobacteria bacterium YIM 96077]|uniref:DNA topoisomerase (ATP-hydrolyzing) n=1 Tax=Phytoactinopolyspora halophila TaxID=1981511 RepID=A0A329QLY0_9ACTN|nr:type IIA DNA topoisomerase subunit B [Actinobacteria bacterium YIM 96077]RAW12432.1 DNA topoisomerase IV subunit B [Phytoactinopolyspora halophila]